MCARMVFAANSLPCFDYYLYWQSVVCDRIKLGNETFRTKTMNNSGGDAHQEKVLYVDMRFFAC